jgi:hypothetical protein
LAGNRPPRLRVAPFQQARWCETVRQTSAAHAAGIETKGRIEMDEQLQDEPREMIRRIRSGRAYARLGDAAALAVPELTLVPRLLRGTSRRWVVLIVAGSVAVVAAIAVVIFVWNAANENTARHASTRFGAALIHDDPNAAPPGAADYVSGVRAYFGAARTATLIGSHQRAVGHDPDTRSFFVADLLLDTRRGAAVVEVEFDNESINSDRVTSVYELAPSSAPGLSAAQRRQLDAAFKARGGTPADAATLAIASSTASIRHAPETPYTPKPSTPKPSTPNPSKPIRVSTGASNPVVSGAAKRLHCVQTAHVDVTKLARCMH